MDNPAEDGEGAPMSRDQEAPAGRAGTYSILFHLRRTVCEEAYVSVPVTDAVMKKEPEADGTYRLDFEALVAAAVRISAHPKVEWRTESAATEMHPVQQPLPEDRRTYDPFLDPEEHAP
jgi:hypothetical protein